VVVDHDSGRPVWAAPGRDRKTVERFLELLGSQRCERIELVSCDRAEWITRPVAQRCKDPTFRGRPDRRERARPARQPYDDRPMLHATSASATSRLLRAGTRESAQPAGTRSL
jgi:Transposase